MIVWLNGQWLTDDSAHIPVQDRGFTLGDGLFETIKARHGRPLHLADHWQRLTAGAAILRLPLPLTMAELEQAIIESLIRNDMSDAALRLTISRGSGQRGLLPPNPTLPTVLLTASPLPAPMGPASLHVAQQVRRNPSSPLCRCKTLSYLDNILARIEAADAGCDDALLLSTDGFVCETTIANLFAVLADGCIVTPPLAHGVLPGVRRAGLLQSGLAHEQGLMLKDLLTAQEIFLTNALSVRAVTRIGTTLIGQGKTGPICQKIMDSLDE